MNLSQVYKQNPILIITLEQVLNDQEPTRNVDSTSRIHYVHVPPFISPSEDWTGPWAQGFSFPVCEKE